MQRKVLLAIIVVLVLVLLAGILYIVIKGDSLKPTVGEPVIETQGDEETPDEQEADPEAGTDGQPALGEGGLPIVNPFGDDSTEQSPKVEDIIINETEVQEEKTPTENDVQATKPEETKPDETEPEVKEKLPASNGEVGELPVVNPFEGL